MVNQKQRTLQVNSLQLLLYQAPLSVMFLMPVILPTEPVFSERAVWSYETLVCWTTCWTSLIAIHYFICCNKFLCILCLSNALHSSIGQNIKSLACRVSGLRCPVRVWKTSNGHNSATRHPIDFMFGSRLEFLARTD